MKNVVLFIFLTVSTSLFAQKQDIVGKVVENFTEKPIENVHITLLKNQNPIHQTLSDSLGKFIFDDIDVGQYDISFSHLSYIPYTIPNIEVSSSKQCYISAELDFSYIQMDELVISPPKDHGTSNNKMALLSSFTIDVEDTRKLAGSLDDPARVAGVLPGVAPYSGFSANFISIRGNSPRGFKYQMEGVELPNPTHFARIGSSGGTFTIFSMQVMDKSDFFTGAFPAEYGNATAGILDVNFRTGSTQKHSYLVKLGTLGLDIATEGPINKKGASYIINYRYAIVGLARIIGYPTQPVYQDLSFNLNFPVSNKGSIKLFSVSGMSDRARIAETDSSKWEQDLDRYKLNLGSKTASFGVNFTSLVGENSVFSTTLFGAVTNQFDNKNYVQDNLILTEKEINNYNSIPITFATSFKHKFGKIHSNKTGGSIQYSKHDWFSVKRNLSTNYLDTIINGNGNSITIKLYSSSNFELSKKITINIGIHSLYYNINNNYKLEPRIGVQYRLNEKNKLSIAYGKHSQTEHFATYLYQTKNNEGKTIFPNKNLNLATANHFIAGYRSNIFRNHKLTIESYFQNLYDVPVDTGTFSILNLNELDDIRPLYNNGKGINYGIDFSLERFTENGLYYMINTSYFRSFYSTNDKMKKSTQYDLKFFIKFLLGKEFAIGKSKNNFFGWNTNFSVMGGQPYTPIEINASRQNRETIENESLAYTKRDDPLIFLDLTITYKTNKKNRTALWSLQLKNLFANGNAIYREYDSVLDKEVTIPSSGFFPNISYRLEF